MYSGRAAGAPFDRGRRQFFCCTRRGTFVFRVFYVFYALAPSLSFRYSLTERSLPSCSPAGVKYSQAHVRVCGRGQAGLNTGVPTSDSPGNYHYQNQTQTHTHTPSKTEFAVGSHGALARGPFAYALHTPTHTHTHTPTHTHSPAARPSGAAPQGSAGFCCVDKVPYDR
jgi:hypothetical protein